MLTCRGHPTKCRDAERVRSLLGGSPWDRSTPLHVTGSALVVHPASGRVLLRWHARQHAWLQVGGHGDPGEDDPFAVALREAGEETGLSDLVAWPDERRAPVHLVIVPVPEGKGEPAHEHADIRYVLSTADPDSREARVRRRADAVVDVRRGVCPVRRRQLARDLSRRGATRRRRRLPLRFSRRPRSLDNRCCAPGRRTAAA